MRRLATALVFLMATTALAADDPYKFKILLSGGYEASSVDFSQSKTLPQYQENATFEANYSGDKSPGIDVGLQWNALKHFGLQAAVSDYSRDLTGTYTASFPHPLYFNKPRTVTGNLGGTLSERAIHACAVGYGHSGSFDLSAWAGVAFFKVEGDVLQDVTYTQSYPYDSVTVTGAATAKANDSPVGFSGGASVDYRFAKKIGAGIQGRYAKATAKFTTPGGSASVDAGGFALGIGLRFYF